jgi:hypothetical protein
MSSRIKPTVVYLKAKHHHFDSHHHSGSKVHFTFSMRLKHGDFVKCFCGKICMIGSSSVDRTDVITFHQAIAQIADDKTNDTCIECAARLKSILPETWPEQTEFSDGWWTE